MFTIRTLLLHSVVLLMTLQNATGQRLLDYTHYPLSVTNTAPPNVLILLDNSESMYQQAHENNFDPQKNYDGYFKSSALYSYVSDSHFEMNPLGTWQGNFLNWLSMRRIDIVRKVLIGGRSIPDSRTGSGTQYLLGEDTSLTGYEILKQYEEGSGTFYPGHVELGIDAVSPLYFGVHNGLIYVGDTPDPFSHHTMQFKIQVKKEELLEPDEFAGGNSAGLLHRINTRARLGLAVLNSDGEGGSIINPIGDDFNNLISTIEQCGMTSGAPLAESLFESVRYFMQISPYYYHNPQDYGLGEQDDPFFFQGFSQSIPCAQSFIILISDGESTQDQNIPASPPQEATGNLRDYDGDGRDSLVSPEEGSDYLDDIALWAHTSDLRTGDQDLEGTQHITLFTIHAFGSGSRLLQDAARNGGFIDTNGNGLPDLTQEWDGNNDGMPDTYYETGDASRLGEKLLQAARQIMHSTASGSGLTIAPNSLHNESSLFQAFYKPYPYPGGTEIHWLGFLHALWIDDAGNIREDTDGDKALVYERDKIIRFIFDADSGETRATLFSDRDGDGSADQEEPDSLVPLETINPLWEAGEKLALRNAGEREIKTFIDRDGDGRVDPGEFIDFSADNARELRPYLRADDDEEATEIIEYIRGEVVPRFRSRTSEVQGTERTWKLGDIVNATPALSKHPLENYHLLYGDASYEEFFHRWRERPLTVFVGANDGMMHAFNGGTYNQGDNPLTAGTVEQGWYDLEHPGSHGTGMGDERWAYIPYNLLPHLKWLTRKDYTHVDYVDLKAKVTDARIFTDSNGSPINNDHPHGWGTVLIGGTGFGGGPMVLADDFGSGREERCFSPSYFALDITTPENPRVLWEFTHTALGFTTAYPAVVRVEAEPGTNQPEDDRWFVLVGSGPTDYRGMSNQPARLFVIDLKTGELVQRFEGEVTNGFMSGSISIDYNLNYNTDVVYTGSSMLPEEQWRGAMYRLSTRTCSDGTCSEEYRWHYDNNPDNWTFSKLFTAPQPITAAPNAALDEHHNLWVYCGTGRYFGFFDRSHNDLQNQFFGLKDPCYKGNCDNDLSLNDLYDSSGILIYQDGTLGNAEAANWNDLLNEIEDSQGWYLDFSMGGERVLNKPTLFGGILTFTTYTPHTNLCSTDGASTLYTLYYQTGTAGKKPMNPANSEDLSGSGGGGGSSPDNGTAEGPIETKTPIEGGIASSPVIHMGKNSFILTSSTSCMIKTLPLQPALNMSSGMESWREE